MDIDSCNVCGEDHSTEECPELGTDVSSIEFDQLSTRARLTLPQVLQVVDNGSGLVGVVAKETIPARTRFGPFEAKRTTHIFDDTGFFTLKLIGKDGATVCLDTTDENECNWMCLVRSAVSDDCHNCIAYQLGSNIFYSTMREVAPGEELQVWYAPTFAKKLGKPTEPVGDARVLLGHRIEPLASDLFGEGEMMTAGQTDDQSDDQGESPNLSSSNDTNEDRKPTRTEISKYVIEDTSTKQVTKYVIDSESAKQAFQYFLESTAGKQVLELATEPPVKKKRKPNLPVEVINMANDGNVELQVKKRQKKKKQDPPLVAVELDQENLTGVQSNQENLTGTELSAESPEEKYEFETLHGSDVKLVNEIEEDETEENSSEHLHPLHEGKTLQPPMILCQIASDTACVKKVPCGKKSNVFVILDNTENRAQISQGKSPRYWDDCGAWDCKKSRSIKTRFILGEQEEDGGQKLTFVIVRDNKVYVEARDKTKKGGKIIKLMQPQPSLDRILIFHRCYSVSKADPDYKRRVTWVEGLPADFPGLRDVAIVEYTGEFNGSQAPHGNSKLNNSSYIRTDPEVMEKLKRRVATEKSSRVYKDMAAMASRASSSPRDLKQCQNAKMRAKAKIKREQS